MANIESNDEFTEANPIDNFGSGGFIRFGFAGVTLQPELLVIPKGSDIAGFFNQQLQLQYLEVPVLLHFALGSANISPYLAAGPSFGFEIGCDVEDDSRFLGGTSDCDDTSFLDNRKSFDLGLTGVAGIALRVGPGNLLVEGRYIHGLLNLSGESGSVLKNRVYAFMVGYSISLGR